MKRLLIASGLAAVLAIPAPADAGYYNVHIQGRGWKNWTAEKPAMSGWTNITLPFNGSAKLNGHETNVTVRNAISTYCSNGNYCIVHCYSAGCLRTLKAVSDLRASGNTLPGLLFTQASASAAGGSNLASMATKGFTGFLAKLLGQQEKIDFDLTKSATRNTWGYIQDDMGVSMYQTCGKKNICKKILFWKICGNKYVGAGIGDGVVGGDSCSGASAAGAVYNVCTVAKYPYRTHETADGVTCYGEDRDHFGMPGRTTKVLGSKFYAGFVDLAMSWADYTTEPDCDDVSGQCDSQFSNPAADFAATPGGAWVTGDVNTTSSNTTYNTGSTYSCFGKCGGFAGSCWCDAACTSIGDCCTDYSAANCAVMNEQVPALPPEQSCSGDCGGYGGACWCDSYCTTYGDCCVDYTAVCY